jgi:hypothetical protein
MDSTRIGRVQGLPFYLLIVGCEEVALHSPILEHQKPFLALFSDISNNDP